MALHSFWNRQGCVLMHPYDIETGAGTMNPMTTLRAAGPEEWKAAYVEPSRRPADGRYGKNPNRLYQHLQYQVILKPSPDNVEDLYIRSLEELGVKPMQHDIRFVEDNWEAPTLGAGGLGWEIWLDGMEITQFTYFQQAGGLDLAPVSVELTYGLERIAMHLQRVDDVYDLEWASGVSYREVRHQDEVEQTQYAFGMVDMPEADFAAFHRDLFDRYHQMSETLLRSSLVLPALDACLKCSHAFNILDASGGVGVTERAAYILRVRQLAVAIARAHVEGPPEA